MLRLDHISLQTQQEPKTLLLQEVSFSTNAHRYIAVIGSSGSGKSTLIKLLAGVHDQYEGMIHWRGKPVDQDADASPARIAYVPQFIIAYDELTVWENIHYTLRLREAGLSPNEEEVRIDEVLNEVGLTEASDRLAKRLSGGEQRRLTLAMELVSKPEILLCDEVTSGLDAKSELEIDKTLHALSRSVCPLVISVTHSLRNVDLFDAILVMHQGKVVFFGTQDELMARFTLTHPEDVYRVLSELSEDVSPHEVEQEDIVEHIPDSTALPPKTPSVFSQLNTLTARRWKLFFRRRAACWLQLGLLIGFPLVVVIFAWRGLPQVVNYDVHYSQSVIDQMENTARGMLQSFEVGSLISALALFQVILLCLMGANNGSREITAERPVFEKEKLAGLNPFAYVASKVLYLSVLVLVQSVWMTVFVKEVCKFPGDYPLQLGMLILVNAAMTIICLGISSICRTTEQSSIFSIYLVGFQLPLSGVMLSLPSVLDAICKPLISLYWGWAGYLRAMTDSRFYDLVQTLSPTEIVVAELAIVVLFLHIIFGILLAFFGCRRNVWN